MKHKKFRVGFYQFRPKFGKIKSNLNKIVNALKNAKADLIVLPELPFTGYYFKGRNEVAELAQDVKDSFIVESLIKLCKKQNLLNAKG